MSNRAARFVFFSSKKAKPVQLRTDLLRVIDL
jgi:hypothetical protein